MTNIRAAVGWKSYTLRGGCTAWSIGRGRVGLKDMKDIRKRHETEAIRLLYMMIGLLQIIPCRLTLCYADHARNKLAPCNKRPQHEQ
jgi:hypothetical protein